MISLKGIDVFTFTQEKYDEYIKYLNSFMYLAKRGDEKKEFAREILQAELVLCKHGINKINEYCKKLQEDFDKRKTDFDKREERQNRESIKENLMYIGWTENNMVQEFIDSDNSVAIEKLHDIRNKRNQLIWEQLTHLSRYEYFLKKGVTDLDEMQDEQAQGEAPEGIQILIKGDKIDKDRNILTSLNDAMAYYYDKVLIGEKLTLKIINSLDLKNNGGNFSTKTKEDARTYANNIGLRKKHT